MTSTFDVPLQSDLPAVLAALSAELGRMAKVQLWRLSDDDAVAMVDDAYDVATRAHTLALQGLAEVHRRNLPGLAGAPFTQAWLTARRRMRPSEARRDVRLARLLSSSAGTGASDQGEGEGAAVLAGLLTGTVSVDQAGCVAMALDELPPEIDRELRVAAERAMVDAASQHGPIELTRLGHRILERVDPDAEDVRLAKTLDREEREARRLRSGTRFADGHGNVFYRLRVSEADDVHIYPVLDTLAAPEPAGPGGFDSRTASQRLADAFVEACRRVSLDGGLPQRGGDRPRIMVTVPLATLKQSIGAATVIDTGSQLGPAAVRRLACDAQIIPLVLGGKGQILDVGRAQRTFLGPVRGAVIARDQGCIHPGCSRPARWCDVHHVIPWWQGGPTSLTNGVMLCGFHHALYDNGTWRIRFGPDHIPESIPPEWIDPAGRPIRHSRFAARE